MNDLELKQFPAGLICPVPRYCKKALYMLLAQSQAALSSFALIVFVVKLDKADVARSDVEKKKLLVKDELRELVRH